jgi:uncharacterized repeat protein (TIGR03806 family)
MRHRNIALLSALIIGCSPTAHPEPRADSSAHGISSRIAAKPYLNMPHRGDGAMPRLLSQTGAFSDARHLIANRSLIPYDLIVAFWSDGAVKSRWVAVPNQKIRFSATEEWQFPPGTVFVKHFELPTDESNPGVRRRLETRLLVRDDMGGVYGVTYRWRADGSDAELLPDGATEDIPIRSVNGEVRHQTWYYPSRKDCLTCHTAGAGGVLGVKTRQLNHEYDYPSGVTDNELRTWSHLGLLDATLQPEQLPKFATLAAADDETRGLEDRARSYLDANCSQCHRPGGTVAYFDARYSTPLGDQGLIDGPVLIDQGIDRPRIIAPHDIWRSIAYMRMNTVGDIRMPPLARETIDAKGVALLGQWINSLPGRPVLDPPTMSQAGGTFASPIDVSLQAKESGADIHYTLDGSEPGTSDPRYEGPIRLTGSTILRARAYKDGFTRSITSQEVYIIGP